MITFENVNKWFGDHHVLRDVNLAVAPGEVLVICGPSGSGKSTLIRCINRLEQIQSGRIIVDNMEVHEKKTSMTRLRAEIGFVFQQFNLYPHMTALANVTLAPVKVRRMEKHAAETLGREILERVGLTDKAAAYPAQLSGGQQQRIALARALVFEPQLVLMDEPLGALDKNIREQMQFE
ncbi:MAG: ATP-binding cassette domain-containing protein, partial [Desulfobacterales bacterium]|nr:ATP-binding cassette domain-containing protein [Desulfobacterales bacterium]